MKSVQRLGYQHHKINHSAGFGRGEETINNLESLWSQLKNIGRFDQGQNFEFIQQIEVALNEVIWQLTVRNTEDQGYKQLAQILEESFYENRVKIIDYN